jgi:hypothetical protein
MVEGRMKTRTIMVGGFVPIDIPAVPETTSVHAERSVRAVFAGEYAYRRGRVEDDVRTIVDVGTNVGAFLLWAMAFWWPKRIARVWGYEPNRAAYDLAQNNGLRYALDPNFVRGDCLWMVLPLAVTIDPEPRLSDETNWGARSTHKTAIGEKVGAVHPGELPAADCLKVDCEGSGHEVFEHYRHWSGVKVAMYETHHETERDVMAAVCRREGLRMVRGNPSDPPGDVRVWTR